MKNANETQEVRMEESSGDGSGDTTDVTEIDLTTPQNENDEDSSSLKFLDEIEADLEETDFETLTADYLITIVSNNIHIDDEDLNDSSGNLSFY